MNAIVLRGVIHGKTIELQSAPGISDGVEVEVVVRRAPPERKTVGDGFLRTEGALSDDLEWDAIMDELDRSRKQERSPQWEEP
jgi:hypothetical protein